jgi:glutamate dehydrogenase (NADP+)
MSSYFETFMGSVRANNPHEPEFIQAVEEVMDDIIPYVENEAPHLKAHKLLERIVEPERIVSFRVCWLDDQQQIQVNRGYRVQANSAIGPYKGGLRFSPSVNLSVLKFLAFEQTFKNSLTGLPLGAGKGGADFDPKGKSDTEIMKFCQSFMTELYRHIGAETDVPAGDIGVGEREIGYLFGQYKRLQNQFTGVLTGKGPSWGGSFMRPEATGFGLLYFVECMLEEKGETLENKVVTISGAGNVAYYAAFKAQALGAKVVTISNSTGTLYDPDGFDVQKLSFIQTLKRDLAAYTQKYPNSQFLEKQKPWQIPCDIALPCATQNELQGSDAKILVQNGCQVVAEGANMPSSTEAIQVFQKHAILYAPGKAANAGGVAVSGLEMSQNQTGLQWSSEKVDTQLRRIMKSIHETCHHYGKDNTGSINYLKGANIGGFVKLAKAMLAQGAV